MEPTIQQPPSKTESGKTVLIRASQRRRISIPGVAGTYDAIAPEGKALAVYSVKFEPGEGSGTKVLQHRGDEVSFVLNGKLDLEVEGSKYTLAAGDAIFIARGQRHRIFNNSGEPATLIFTLAPPEY